ncbi:hypothetical protein Glove_141g29 [Diversispora epigaea]|uniref:Protein kinase domain-containing protein n=1 Tax=Diversispora epigaea TaxID=1348612 RepID=A0A397IYV3_9GLOM|nr:hypothetical protein Glove_141g29 [Diversispora epigaea]
MNIPFIPMSQEIKKIIYCPEGHSSNDFFCSDYQNLIHGETCSLCTREHFIQDFKTWSSGNAEIDGIIQESQIDSIYEKLHWIPYDNFQNIKHVTDGGHGSLHSAKLENGIKWKWNFINQDWRYDLIGYKVALKEIKDSKYDIFGFLNVIKTFNNYDEITFASYYGISRNPSTQNYIIIMDSFDNDLHNFLAIDFGELEWNTKIDILASIAWDLEKLHEKNFVNCDLHGRNILVNHNFHFYFSEMGMNLDLCKLENDSILNPDDKNDIVYGSIPYLPPEVLRGNDFTREGDIYSFGGIMYEIVTAQQSFVNQAHDTYLMIDICNGVRPKVPDLMLNWIPEWYLDLMYRCWSDDPSERPTSFELSDLFYEIYRKHSDNIVDNNVMRQLKIADENQKNASKSQKKELFSYSSKSHPQSCYIGRYIKTLHGLHDLLEEIKSGKSSDPNLLKPNESTGLLKLIDEIQSPTEK